MNHFFVDPGNVSEESIRITGNDVNHIRKVLRMKQGEQLLLSDGQGNDYTCEIASYEDSCVICSILSQEASGTEPAVQFYLFQGLPKSDKLEHVIQKSVELGVFQIIPVQTARTIVKYDAGKGAAKRQRWQKIAESAAKQSRRGIIPEVKEITSLKNALKEASDLDLVLIPYENYKDMNATRAALQQVKAGMKVGIFVGPEGGFEQGEVEQACKETADGGAAAIPISLGARILRTETAPLMLLSVLMFQTEI